MPISDEVIELAPVKKTKKKLILMFVAMGVLLALAVAFLVMYLIKPSVEEDNSVVKGVTMSSGELFSDNENGKEVKYASIGNEYTVFANITVENGASPNVQWEVSPMGAVTEIERSEDAGAENGAFFKFKPNVGFHNTEVTIKARSQSNVSKSQEVKFKIVNQGAETLNVTQYFPQGDSSNVVKVKNDAISIPFYAAPDPDTNNKTFVMSFEQLGKYNESTGEYSKISVITSNGVASNAVRVESSNESVVSINGSSASAFNFRARGVGSAEITISANINNADVEKPLIKKIKVTVENSALKGYIGTVYFFNKAVVDADFIESVLDGTRNRLDVTKLNKVVDGDVTLVKNPKSITVPYSNRVTYDDIFSHILINPITIQYDSEKREIKTDWHKKIEVKSSNENALKVNTDRDGDVTLAPLGLSNANDKNTACTLSITDKTPGSIKAGISTSVNIVAQNESGKLSVSAGGKDYDDGVTVPMAQNGVATLSVVYRLRMPGKTNLETLFDSGYVTTSYKLVFDPSYVDVSVNGETALLKPNENLKLKNMTFKRVGADVSSISDFEGTAQFTVKIKSGVKDGTYSLRFEKIGTNVSGDPAGEGLDALDASWNKTANFEVTAKATRAFFIDKDDAETLIRGENNTRAGKFVPMSGDATKANIYVQNQSNGTVWNKDTLFDIKDLVDTDVEKFGVSLRSTQITGAFKISSEGIVTFTGDKTISPSELAMTLVFTVTDVENKEVGKLTLYVYLIDAVHSFAAIDEIGSTLYSGDLSNKNPLSPSIIFPRNKIKVIKTFNQEPTQYNNITNINVYYNGIVSPQTKLEYEIVGNLTHFSYNGIALFAYDSTGQKITALKDLYAESYKAKVDFSNIRVEFLLGSSEYYAGTVAPSGIMECIFTRKADDVAVFKRNGYDDQHKLPIVSGAFEQEINQGDSVSFYVSSIVNVNIDNAADSIVVRRGDGAIATVEQSYIILRDTFDEVNGQSADIQGVSAYYWVRFLAPDVDPTSVTGEEEYNFDISSEYSSVSSHAKLTVQNVARGITAITLYGDKDCDKEITADDITVFGGFNNAELYSVTVYVKIDYVEFQSRFTHYESAELSLPAYLTASGMGIKPDEDDDNTYVITPAGNADAVGTDGAVMACTITLSKTASDVVSDTFTIAQAHNIGAGRITLTRRVRVATGLKSVQLTAGSDTYTVNAATSVKIAHTFVLSNMSDAPSLTFALQFNGISSLYPDIAYGNTDEQWFAVEYIGMDGLEFVNDTASATAPTFGLKIDLSKRKTAKGIVTVKFIDRANGASENNVFTVNIEVTIVMDIFALDFGDEGNEYEITTTGAAGSDQTKQIGVVYNNGNENVQPTAQLIADSNVASVVRKTGENSYSLYTGNDVRIVKNVADYTLVVSNGVKVGNDYYVRLNYGDIYRYRPITIATTAHRLELAEDNTVSVESVGGVDTVTVTVSDELKTFKLAASVVNEGTGLAVSGKTVTYSIADGTVSASDAVIDADGIITVKPSAVTGSVMYRASYVDVGGTGKAYNIDIKLVYRVAASSVYLDIPDSNTFDSANKTLTLYYAGVGKYTYINLADYIKAQNDFGVAFGNSDLQKSVALKNSTDGNALKVVSGTQLIPTAVTDPAGIPVIVTASSNGTPSKTYEFNVVVRAIDALVLDSTGGTINLIENGSVTVTPDLMIPAGLNVKGYSLVSDKSGLTITDGAGYAKTVKVAAVSAAAKGEYKLTATVEYDLASGSCAMLEGGAFKLSAVYTLTVNAVYAPEFKLMNGEVELTPYDGTSGTRHIVTQSGDYKLAITNAYGTAAYSAVADGVVKIEAFGGVNAKVSPMPNVGGAFAVTVTAGIFGQEYRSVQNYYFTYGAEATAKLYMSENGGAYEAFAGAAQKIDFADKPYKFKYEIGDIDTAVVSESDITINVGGDVEVGAIVKGDGVYYVEITARKATTLTVGGTVMIGARTLYLEKFSVILTSSAPVFTISANKTDLLPSDTVTVTVGQTDADFKGDYDNAITYSVVSIDECAKVESVNNNSAIIKADKNIIDDRTFVVRATVTVKSGAHAGTYTVESSPITVIGVALPTIRWNASEIVLGAGESKTFGPSDYTFDGSVEHNGSGSPYIFTIAPNSSVTIDSADNLTAGTDYKYETDKLTVFVTDKTRAGGKLTVRVTATITSAVHSGATVYAVTDVIIRPQAKPVNGIVISNGIGSYDVSGAIEPYTTSVPGYFVHGKDYAGGADEYSVTSIRLKNSFDSDIAEINGRSLVLKKNVTSSKTIALTATIMMTSGAYAGTSFEGTTSVTIKLPQITDAEVEWSGTEYKTVALANLIGIDEVGGDITVTKIHAAATTDAQSITIIGNDTAAPTLTVDRSFNLSIGTHGSAQSVTIAYTITLSNGHVYYNTARISVGSADIQVKAYVEDSVIENDGKLTRNSGDAFILTMSALSMDGDGTAASGFDVRITDISVSLDGSASTLITAPNPNGANNVVFTVADVSESKENVTVTISATVGGRQITYVFGVDVIAPESTAAYTADNTSHIDYAVGDNGAVTSHWQSNGSTQYVYGYSVSIVTPDGAALSKYFKSIGLYTSAYGAAIDTVNDLDINSGTLYFDNPDGNKHEHRNEIYNFYLKFEFNTDVKIDRCNIDVNYNTYNTRYNYGSPRTVTVRYALRVIGNVTVNLDCNAAGDNTAQCDPATVEVSYKGEYAGLPTPTRTGYDFNGWYTASNGGTPIVYEVGGSNNTQVTSSVAHTLYAQWSPATYVVALNDNANGDSVTGSVGTINVTYNSAYSGLPANPQRKGHTFTGWYTEPIGGSLVKNGDRVTVTDNATVLYAQWTKNTYKITLYANGGTLAGLTSLEFSAVYGTTFSTHSSVVPTRTGYEFNGWRTAASGGSSVGDSITVEGEIKLYAAWTEKTVTVTFDTHVAGLNFATATVSFGGSYGSILPKVASDARPGYKFVGWFTQESGGVIVTEDSVVPDVTAVTLHAQWAIESYAVTLDADGGKIADLDTLVITAQFNASVQLPTPTRDGYVFDGWYDASEKVDGTAYVVTKAVTLVAKWSQYTVKFDLNYVDAPENTIAPVTYAVGAVYGTTLPEPTRDGFTFVGWCTDKDNADDTTVAADTVVTSSLTLYAVWTPDETPSV